jgi:hypothetical protein
MQSRSQIVSGRNCEADNFLVARQSTLTLHQNTPLDFLIAVPLAYDEKNEAEITYRHSVRKTIFFQTIKYHCIQDNDLTSYFVWV